MDAEWDPRIALKLNANTFFITLNTFSEKTYRCKLSKPKAFVDRGLILPLQLPFIRSLEQFKSWN